MSLQTDDCDIRDVRFWMEIGGNGDFYLNLMDMNTNQRINMRVSTSGGRARTEVKVAVANLFRAMEQQGLNAHPQDDEP